MLRIHLRVSVHTTSIRNNMSQKCEGNCGLWVLNEMIKKIHPEVSRDAGGDFSKGAPWRGPVGAPWVGPWDSQIFTTIKKVTGTSRNGLKSVTVSKQGRRNGFFKGSPLDGAPWGLHGWAPGIHKFLLQSKTLLAPLEMV